MNSYTVTAVVGKVPGYANDGMEVLNITSKDVQGYLEELSKNRRYYISFVMTDGKCIYKKDWGCPDGGEDVIVFQATMNPTFVDDSTAWLHDALYYIGALKELYKQTTVTVSITQSDVIYLNGRVS